MQQSETFSHLIFFKKITAFTLLFIFSLWNWDSAWAYSWWLLSSGLIFYLPFPVGLFLILITHHQTKCLPLVNSFYLLKTVSILFQLWFIISISYVFWQSNFFDLSNWSKSWHMMDTLSKRGSLGISGDNSQSSKHPQHPLINLFHEHLLYLRCSNPLCNWTLWKLDPITNFKMYSIHLGRVSYACKT